MGQPRLNEEQEVAVLKDFAVWSGGFTPAQMTSEDHRIYAAGARDADLDEQAVYWFLCGEKSGG